MEKMEGDQPVEMECTLNGFWGNWRLPSSMIQRTVRLKISSERNEYTFQFYCENPEEPFEVKGILSDLQLGIEHFVWLGEEFLYIEETKLYRHGRSGNLVSIVNEIGQVVVVLGTMTPHPGFPRVRCDFFVSQPSSKNGFQHYLRFEIIVALDSAKKFGATLLESLNWSEYPV